MLFTKITTSVLLALSVHAMPNERRQEEDTSVTNLETFPTVASSTPSGSFTIQTSTDGFPSSMSSIISDATSDFGSFSSSVSQTISRSDTVLSPTPSGSGIIPSFSDTVISDTGTLSNPAGTGSPTESPSPSESPSDDGGNGEDGGDGALALGASLSTVLVGLGAGVMAALVL